MLSAVPGGCPIVLDGLAFGALPEAGELQSRTPLIALVHLPLALEAGLDPQADSFRVARSPGTAKARRAATAAPRMEHAPSLGYRNPDGPDLLAGT
jgi:hypothetical protein